MAAAAFQLTVVFSVIPFLPAVVMLAQERYGLSASVCLAAVWYIGYPLFFGALMWRHLDPTRLREKRR